MISRILNTATNLSLLLFIAAVVMWVRSWYVTEGWESKPHPAGIVFNGSGHHRQWAVEVSDGRLVYVNHRFLVMPADPAIPGGYYRLYSSVDGITGLRHNRRFPDQSRYLNQPHRVGRIPGVIEWCEKLTVGTANSGSYVAVPLPTIAFAALLFPVVREALRRCRVRCRPAFQVVPIRTDPCDRVIEEAPAG